MIANTYFEHHDENKLTYRGLKTKPKDEVTPEKFSQLDFVLCGSSMFDSIIDISVNRNNALNSHHFVLAMDLRLELERKQNQQTHRKGRTELTDQLLRESFTTAFSHHMTEHNTQCMDLDDHASIVVAAFKSAANVLPDTAAVAKRPWISPWTIGLIQTKNKY